MWTLISLRRNPCVYAVLPRLSEQFLIFSGDSRIRLLLILVLFMGSTAISTFTRELLSAPVKQDGASAPLIGGLTVVLKTPGFQRLILSLFCYTCLPALPAAAGENFSSGGLDLNSRHS